MSPFLQSFSYGFVAIALATSVRADDTATSAERLHDVLGPDSLVLPAPIDQWDNAIPLGNGATGGLLWGAGNKLNLSLDRGDLWDERAPDEVRDPKFTYKTLLEAIAKKDGGTYGKYFDGIYDKGRWTKIPGGRLVIELPADKQAKEFQLDFEKALGSVVFTDGTRAEAFFSATSPVALLRLPATAKFDLVRPSSINQLGYPAPEFTRGENEVSYLQKTAAGGSYAFSVRWKTAAGQTLAAISITSGEQGGDPLAKAREGAASALAKGWDTPLGAHLAWWKSFYRTSSVTLPEPRLQHHYDLVKYYYGASSRAQSDPMPLQGVWTADGGGLPPWKGDYHNDLNTQMTYVAWQTAGLTDPGMSYLNYYWNRMPEFRAYGKNFFGMNTAMVPGVMTRAAQPMGGWPPYAMSLTAGLWNGHAFYRYWKTTRDDRFLAERGYPWLKEVATSVFSLCSEKDGKLVLPVTSSPEWNDGGFAAYLKPNSNFDQALLLWSSGALEEMAAALGKKDEAAKWAAIKAKLAPLKTDPSTGELLVAEGIPFKHSHRHFSHAMAIYPLGLLDPAGSPDTEKTVKSTVKQLIGSGSGAWVGYSFTWGAALAARAGMPEDSARPLRDFERAFVTRNGFHVNGDQTKSGLSGFTYRPFTLEGNFLFMDAIHEMLMQSHTGVIRLFPAVPEAWKDASFADLRAEGGFKISATRKDGATRSFTITAAKASTAILADPFPGGEIASLPPGAKRENGRLAIPLQPGVAVTVERK
ncbi:glycoside hydrolase N-terminal domain-containing protein [Luteolibacter ambystomatis]|uniref:Glycoside hydrolase N-terminal domain-containing protein n=1 Tax=Luteolibacter ambystomatis TaxID=2824561 RepID=A0A975G608_9BACT|nr:glycoside hydrolase N-terminal domain-containing protein [Luteolibacter ambystomatis]QUE49416.1 glycoside hydrolase N-terminal domain-containing protein [Luteolibacter ambystomatis]